MKKIISLEKYDFTLNDYPEFAQYSFDKDIILLAVGANGKNIYFASQELKEDKDVILTALKSNGFILGNLSKKWCDVDDVVLTALGNNGESFEYASERLKGNVEFVNNALKSKTSTKILEYVSEEIKNNETIVKKAILINEDSIKYASDKIRNNKTIGSMVVKRCGDSFEGLGDKLKDDEGLLKIAIKTSYSRAFRYASNRLKDNKEIVKYAMLFNAYSLQFASNRLQHDIELLRMLKDNDNNDEFMKAVIYQDAWYKERMLVLEKSEESEKISQLMTNETVKKSLKKF